MDEIFLMLLPSRVAISVNWDCEQFRESMCLPETFCEERARRHVIGIDRVAKWFATKIAVGDFALFHAATSQRALSA